VQELFFCVKCRRLEHSWYSNDLVNLTSVFGCDVTSVMVR